jgi:hypothetical protein
MSNPAVYHRSEDQCYPDPRRHPPAENVASIVGHLFALGSTTLRGGANLVGTLYAAAVWGDHPCCDAESHRCDHCHHVITVDCRPHVSSCCHCCR